MGPHILIIFTLTQCQYTFCTFTNVLDVKTYILFFIFISNKSSVAAYSTIKYKS